MLEAARGSSGGPLVFVSTSFYSPQAGTKQIDLFRGWIRRAILVHGHLNISVRMYFLSPAFIHIWELRERADSESSLHVA